MIVARNLGEPIERATEGKVVAFRNSSDRFRPDWGEVLDLGTLRRGPYLDFAALFLPGPQAEEFMPMLQRLQGKSMSSAATGGATIPTTPCSTPTRT